MVSLWFDSSHNSQDASQVLSGEYKIVTELHKSMIFNFNV